MMVEFVKVGASCSTQGLRQEGETASGPGVFLKTSHVHTCVCVTPPSYPELKPIQSINAHPSNCICIKFDPTGKYFATGSADALVSLWDVEELVCVRCFSRLVCRPPIPPLQGFFTIEVFSSIFPCRLDWPVRTLSFSHDGKMLASASEDHFIDIAEVETGQ